MDLHASDVALDLGADDGRRPISESMILSRSVGSSFNKMLRIDTNVRRSGNIEMNP